ncbi:MAG: MipA/OmpV family protein [Sedimentisphaerales bacterium]
MANKKLVLLSALLFCTIASAEDANTSSTADGNMTLLLGPSVVVLDKPYKGKDAEVFPYPAAIFIYDRFYFAIDTAGYRLLANQRTAAPAPGTTLLYLDAIAKWRSDGYDSSDSDALRGMHDRHGTVDAGGEFGVAGDWGSVTTSLVTDALDQHDGQEVRITYGKRFSDAFNVKDLKLTPSVGLAWQSNNLVNYYYGVRPGEARPGRPAYRPGEAVNWLAGLDGTYQLNDKWALFAGITIFWLDDEIRNSPIVSRDYAVSFIGGAMYKF